MSETNDSSQTKTLLASIKSLSSDSIAAMLRETADLALVARRDFDRLKADSSILHLPDDRRKAEIEQLEKDRAAAKAAYEAALKRIDSRLSYYKQDPAALRQQLSAARKAAIDSQADLRALLQLQKLHSVAICITEQELELLQREVS